MNERIAITGVAGFIGGHLAQALIERGVDVIGIDNFDPYYDRSLKEDNVRELTETGRFHFREGDIRSGAKLAQSLEGVEAVVHLAARPGIRHSVRDPRDYASINVEGTLRVLDACRHHAIRRFIFASSSSVYGDSSPVPLQEDAAAVVPLSPYAATKRAGEMMCGVYARLHGFRVAILRLFTVYGPRQRPDLAIHKFTGCLLDGSAITQYGDGTMERDYTHVSDIVGGIVRAVSWTKSGESCSEAFNLGTGRAIRLDRLIGLISGAVGVDSMVVEVEPPPGEVQRTWADTSKARRVLGYESRVSIEEGIIDFVDWYRGKYGYQSSSVT